MCQYWIGLIYNDTVNVVNIMVISSFFTYWIAETETLQFSGILALVTLGIGLSAIEKSTVDRKILTACHGFWKYAMYLSETLIFILIGIFIGHE